MGIQSSPSPRLLSRALLVATLFPFSVCSLAQTIAATAVPLLLPTTVVFDSSGNIYVAETNRHIVDRIDASGSLTIIAGNGAQGFSGDSGPATSAQLDSPQGLAFGSDGSLYIADSHNHRIRKVAANGTITTVVGNGSPGFSVNQLNLPVALAIDSTGSLDIADANNHRIRQLNLQTGSLQTIAGNGLQGDQGDGSSALSASIDTPSGLAVDGAQNLYIADTHNRRIRRVDHATGIITTVVAPTALRLPRGLSLDSSGNLYIADTNAHRILRIATDGTIATVAGEGTQGYAGDNGPATAALLDSPRSASVSPAGLVTIADTANQRLRAIGGDGILRPFGGVGLSPQSAFTLTSPSVVLYGTGTITASLSSTTAASGAITFYEVVNGVLAPLATASLSGNSAMLSTSHLSAGSHRLLATYAGDATHLSVESNITTLTVSPALVSIVPVNASSLYGQPIPTFTSSVAGVLAQDSGFVQASLTTAATNLSPAGTYPISVALSGSSSANYQLATSSAGSLTIGQVPTTVTIASSNPQGSVTTLSARVVSSTQGVPTGSVSFLDAANPLGSSRLDAAGNATISTSLGSGTHSLSAAYTGDTNFLASVSSSLSLLGTTTPANPVTSADFALSTSGSASQTASAGGSATYAFTVSVQNGPLNSPILLSASGTPSGATTTFSPTYLPPGGSVSTFTFTVLMAANARVESGSRSVFAAVLCGFAVFLRRRRPIKYVAAILVVLLAGCGDRVTSLPTAKTNSTIYPMVVTATSTSATGATLQRTAAVTLTVQ